MFMVTLGKSGLRRLGTAVLCAGLLVGAVAAGRWVSTRAVTAGAGTTVKIKSTQDIAGYFTGYGLEVDAADITADKVKIPRKWDDSFSAFNTVVSQSGLDLAKYRGKTVEKWLALIPAKCTGDAKVYGVLLVYKEKAVGSYLLEKPSGAVTGLADAQRASAEADAGVGVAVGADAADAGVAVGGAGDAAAAGAEAIPGPDAEAADAGAALDADLGFDADGYPVE